MPNIHFTDADWERVQRDNIAWWAGELPRPLVYLDATEPFPEQIYGKLSNYPLEMPAEQVVDIYERYLSHKRYYADAFPWWWMDFGPGIVAGFLGATVHSVTEPLETVWFSPPRDATLSELEFTYDPDNVWWQRVQAITTAAVERFGAAVAVSHTDLGGNLDLLASFRGTQKLLFDVADQPEQVERQAARLTQLWLRYYDELDAIIRPACRGTSCWTPLWSPGTTYMLQCDFSYMISPAMFERFVLPDLTACCDHLDHGFYHLDGPGEIPHLDLLLSIPRLRGIQWIPGDGNPPPHEWLDLLKRIRDGGKLCQIYTTPDGARHVVRNLGGRGFLFVIMSGSEFTDPARAEGFMTTLTREDISLNKNQF